MSEQTITVTANTEGARQYLKMVESYLHSSTKSAMQSVPLIIKQSIISNFLKASQSSIPNTQSTVRFKIFNLGIAKPETLIESGSLLKSLMEGEAIVGPSSKDGFKATYAFAPPEAGQDVAFPEYGQRRKNPHYAYIWTIEQPNGPPAPVHAFGLYENRKVIIPPRPFLATGILEGQKRAIAVIYAAIRKLLIDLRISVPRATFFPLDMGKEFKITTWDVLMTVMPPSGIYATIGAGFDIAGFFTGSFTGIQTDRWLMSFAKGQVGATKKVQRRKIRRGLWGL